MSLITVELLILFALNPVMLIVVILAARGVLEPNGILGFWWWNIRFSDAAWRAGHQAAQTLLLPFSIVAVMVGAVVLVLAQFAGTHSMAENIGVVGVFGYFILFAIVYFRTKFVAGKIQRAQEETDFTDHCSGTPS
ncbi:MAG: hypothetical protein FWF43_05270 [Propionibacteriaceae bacterium]|nr:hypothetical protein [Propionibacteriaceae bacterium]